MCAFDKQEAHLGSVCWSQIGQRVLKHVREARHEQRHSCEASLVQHKNAQQVRQCLHNMAHARGTISKRGGEVSVCFCACVCESLSTSLSTSLDLSRPLSPCLRAFVRVPLHVVCQW